MASPFLAVVSVVGATVASLDGIVVDEEDDGVSGRRDLAVVTTAGGVNGEGGRCPADDDDGGRHSALAEASERVKRSL